MKTSIRYFTHALTSRALFPLLLAVSVSASADVVRIPVDAPTFEDAITLAQQGDTVLVAPGVYLGSGNANIFFHGKSLVIIGEAGADSTELLLVSDSEDGFVLTDTEPEGVVIRGLTIRGGRNGVAAWDAYPLLEEMRLADNRVGVKFLRGNTADSLRTLGVVGLRFEGCDTGLAILSVSSTSGEIALIETSQFLNNGRGLFYYAGEAGTERWTTIRACNFEQNQYGVYSTDFLFPEEVRVDSCAFTDNTTAIVNSVTLNASTIAGGTTGIRGYLSSRIVVENSSFTGIEDVVLKSNVWHRLQSGGSHWWLDPGFYLTGCLIYENPGAVASIGGFVDEDPVGASFFSSTIRDNGGGIVVQEGVHALEMDSCLYSGNGAGILIQAMGNDGLRIHRSTLANNRGPAVRTSTYRWPVEISQSLIVANDTGIEVTYLDSLTLPQISCSNVFGSIVNYTGLGDPTGADNNLSADPLLCDTGGSEFSVFDTSPCLSAPCGLIGYAGAGCALPAISTLTVDASSGNFCVSDSQPVIAWSPLSELMGGQVSYEIEIGTDSDWTTAELWSTGTIVSADTFGIYAGVPLEPNQIHYVRVRAESPQGWSGWFHDQFRLNRAPSAPESLTADSSLFGTPLPTLHFLPVFDPDADSIGYLVECANSPLFDSLLGIAGATTITDTICSWVPTTPFSENQLVWWRVRTLDQCEAEDSSVARSFWVNSENEPPSAPTLISPATHSVTTVYDLTPPLTWSESVDNDPFDSIRYRVEISLDTFTTILVAVDSLTTTGTVLSELSPATTYWWRVQGADRGGLTGDFSALGSFRTWIPGDLNGTNTVTVADLTRLVSYLFLAGAPIEPSHIADLTGDCATTIADLIALSSYTFDNSAPLVPGCAGP